ncbi:ABC transporter permease subunit [Bacillus sp. H-16]|uniref:ABC transporter permease n=1 Tax=Alteribacter salitolerans TaxID=2912333 RepID=UPI00196450F9|nr:ABC transporter permease subunit [Alteribacter salitolerans]MBM7096498.1 ABC transporter permease subunit [Alteribacter salitolerans]
MKTWFQANKKTILLTLPASLLTLLTLYSIFQGLVFSFRDGWNEYWTMEAYTTLFSHPAFWDSLRFSLSVTMVSTVIALVAGTALAKVFYTYLARFHWKWLAWLPMLFPHFVAAYLIMVFFSQSGWIASLTYQLGLIKDPAEFLILTNDQRGAGLILAYVWKEIPFVMLMMLPVFYEMDHRLKDAVTTLGGGSFRRFWDVEWKYIQHAMLEISVILFAFIIGAFEVPYLIGATYPQMLPVLSYNWFYGGDWGMRPSAFALIALLTLCILVFYYFLSRRIRRLRERMWGSV